jgi:hypothetical protein
MFGNIKALTGKRVYGSGGYAPNRGRVSAMGNQGYVRRSLTQQTRAANMHGSEGYQVGATRFGNDGQSDTRSGLAQAALGRMVQTPGTKPIRPGQFPAPNPPMNQTPGTKPNRPGGRHGGQGNGRHPGRVIIGKNGQMRLPYDGDYSDQVMADLADFNDQLQQLQIGSQQQSAAYSQGLRDEGQAFGQQKIGDLGTNSGAGMAFSSRYATDVANTAQTHQGNVNALTMQNDQYNQQVAAQRAAIQDQFNRELQAAALQRARTAGTKAGSLGYGHGRNRNHKGHKGKGK